MLIRVDFDAARLILAPGSTIERVLPLPDNLMPPTRIRSIEVYGAGLVVGLPGGAEATIEMGESESAETLRAGRPIVYLDQNHWSVIGLSLGGDDRVPKDLAEAARWLTARADSGEILMPISAGRLVETGAMYGDRREAIAGALLRFSRGWQMRNPQLIRRLEFARALGARDSHTPVFVPGMVDTFASATDGPERRISWALALYEAMLEAEAVEDPHAVGAKAKDEWAEKWIPVAEALRHDEASRDTVAGAARANLLLDAIDDIRAVSDELNLTLGEALDALARPGTIEAQPMLGLMLQVLTARLHNASQRPEAGDLFDFVYLPCAAAYADVLVGERRMISNLRGARRPPARAALAATLPEAVAHVEAALARPSGTKGQEGEARSP